jgi:hypothetical protein
MDARKPWIAVATPMPSAGRTPDRANAAKVGRLRADEAGSTREMNAADPDEYV